LVTGMFWEAGTGNYDEIRGNMVYLKGPLLAEIPFLPAPLPKNRRGSPPFNLTTMSRNVFGPTHNKLVYLLLVDRHSILSFYQQIYVSALGAIIQ